MSLTVDIKDVAGKKTGTFALPAEIFDVQVNIPLIHQVVTAQLAAARQGSHKAKNRGEVSGGGKKPFKQKGTGRARQGSTRSPNQRHGGVAHGPVPRLYDQRTPKKMIKAALAGVLSDRQRNERIHIVDGIVSAPNTKGAITAVRQFTDRKRSLVVLSRTEESVWVKLRNVDGLHLIASDQLNAYDVVVADDVIFSKNAIDEFVQGPAKGKSVTAVARESEVEVSA
ncbi:MAG: 50S ribosomal protein L4 [Actinobacteria bacterium]|nr:50S ribosomal protein L4 [Actinomycetota bacterium]NDB07563.1 50S ribosomal protein L4 [Actinomycetota bacterium]NDI09466.1 50S ribosomal protein L4 [Actinomycetota bacterium]